MNAATVHVFSNIDKDLFIEFTDKRIDGRMFVCYKDQRYELGFACDAFILRKVYWEPSEGDWYYLNRKQLSSILDARYASPEIALKAGCIDVISACLDSQIKQMIDEIEAKHTKLLDEPQGNDGE